ncbi:MAG: T9SS type A sorting domain-containing protein [Muribaculaceae bacterium]|nr:T9SS type A sorting domain-containing protein [Muribaculaceae bacterium]
MVFNKLFIFVAMLCIPLAVCAQSNVTLEFQYDAAGNRISRQLATTPRSSSEPVDNDTKFSVYPTIVYDFLNIAAQNDISNKNFHYSISNINGNVLLTGDLLSQITQLSICLPSGYYIINIFSANEQSSFTFIKR